MSVMAVIPARDAQSTVADPRVCAAMMGQLVKGLGADRIVWGTDAVWTGSPQ